MVMAAILFLAIPKLDQIIFLAKLTPFMQNSNLFVTLLFRK
jgi:hypothetical protein